MAGHFLCLGGDHLRKLKKYKPTKFKAKDSVYNKELADYAVSFIECLCHTKGTWAAEKYSVSVLIPKDDTETVNAVNKAIDAAIEEGCCKIRR